MTAKESEKLARAFWCSPNQGASIKLGENFIEIVPKVVKIKRLSDLLVIF
jgi:hypothetical protein